MQNIPVDPKLAELLEKVRHRVMTPEEEEAQRLSWVRGEMGLGTDLDEEKWRREHD